MDSVKTNNLREHEELLKPFYQRASEAEERISRLEAALVTNKDTGSEEISKTISDLQTKIEDMKIDHISDKASSEIKRLSTENAKLQSENAKLQYQIVHLLRALKEADSKEES